MNKEICEETEPSPILLSPVTRNSSAPDSHDRSPFSDLDDGVASDVTLDTISNLNLDDSPIHEAGKEYEGDNGLHLSDAVDLSARLNHSHHSGLESINHSNERLGRGMERSTRRRERNICDGLKLLNVSCCETGVTLYQESWNWTGGKEQDSIGKLVASFHQFANSIQCGEIGLVNFLAPNFPSHHKAASSSYSNMSSLRRSRSVSKTLPDAMQMLCTQSNGVAVAVFYYVRKDIVTDNAMQQPMREFMEACKSIFGDIYESVIEDLRPQLRSVVKEGSNQDLKEFQKKFDNFKAITTRLRLVILSPHTKKEDNSTIKEKLDKLECRKLRK